MKCTGKVKGNQSAIVYIVTSMLYTGPIANMQNRDNYMYGFNGLKSRLNTTECAVHSLMGTLYKHWKSLQLREKNTDILIERLLSQPVFVEHIQGASSDVSRENARLDQEIASVTDKYGNAVALPVELTESKGMVIIPLMYKASAHQPTINPQLLDISIYVSEFVRLVEQAMCFKTTKVSEGAYTKGSDDMKLIVSLDQQIMDIKQGLLQCVEVVYPGQYTHNEVSIPSRLKTYLTSFAGITGDIQEDNNTASVVDKGIKRVKIDAKETKEVEVGGKNENKVKEVAVEHKTK
jgi:hypothetical protein